MAARRASAVALDSLLALATVGAGDGGRGAALTAAGAAESRRGAAAATAAPVSGTAAEAPGAGRVAT
ncbi:MAG TPA: hypothetical protein VFT84_06995, partial [Gemmatimonadales bacterium]|nr:hypothetical protein [Gemmatimonadales bacterium]